MSCRPRREYPGHGPIIVAARGPAPALAESLPNVLRAVPGAPYGRSTTAQPSHRSARHNPHPTLRRLAASPLASTASCTSSCAGVPRGAAYIGVLFVLGGLPPAPSPPVAPRRGRRLVRGARRRPRHGRRVRPDPHHRPPRVPRERVELSGLVSLVLEPGFAAIALPALMRRLPAGPRERPVGAR